MANKEFKLLSFHFHKILIERDIHFKGKLSETASNIDIKSIEKEKLGIIDQEALNLLFSFNLKFGDVGKIEMDGNMVLLLDKETEKQVLTEWKDKKLPEDIRLIVLNLILQKSSIKALQFEEEVGLPLHIQLPKLQIQKSEKQEEKKS